MENNPDQIENSIPLQEENKEDNTSNKNFYIAITTIFILTIGIFFGAKYLFSLTKTDKIIYNNFVFTKLDDAWHTQWQGNNGRLYLISMRNNPYEVENVQIIGKLNESFNHNPTIYITFDPLAKEEEFQYIALAESELLLNLMQALNKNINISCITNQTEACYNSPIVTCDDLSKSVIYLKSDGPTQILLNNSCIIIQGEDKELARATERVLYQWYKIMK